MNNRRAALRDQLRIEFSSKREAIRTRLHEFARVPPEEYFYELVYCLLTPQSSAVHAATVVALLRNADLEEHELDLAELLRRDSHYIRFHNTKARRILAARKQVRAIIEKIQQTPDAPELRSWLVSTVDGFGLKEASHFLRNIGRLNLAILDRHILRNLRRYGVIRAIPKTLTPKRYFSIERSFLRFAETTGISLDELDLLFWSRETGQILK